MNMEAKYMVKDIDLKLLKVINTLIESGSVTKTAELHGLTPGSISYALKKARKLTGAMLFIRTKHGMRPDSTALELNKVYREFIDLADSAERPVYEPEQRTALENRKEMKINTYAPFEMLLAEAAQQASSANRRWRYIFNHFIDDTAERMHRLKNYEADIDIGAKLPPDEQISKMKIFTSRVVVLAGEENKKIGSTFTIADWYNCQHAMWSSASDFYANNIVHSEYMIAHLRERDVVMVSDNILNMVIHCAQSNCIMLIPEFYSQILMGHFPVRFLQMPEGLELRYDCYLHYHNHLAGDHDMISNIDTLLERIKKKYNYV